MSIRAVADATGVTPPSIYRHFTDKQHLLFEVCARQFERLDDVIEAACAGIDDPLEAMRARGRAYVRFGVEHPEHYRIMFMGPAYATPDDWNDLLASGSFAHLIDGLRAVADAGLVQATHRGGAAGHRAARVGQHPRPHVAARRPAEHALARPRAVRRRPPRVLLGRAPPRAPVASAAMLHGLRRRASGHRHLLTGSAALVLTAGVQALSGALFWLIAARVDEQTDVGHATALFTSVLFVAFVAGLGQPVAAARYAAGRTRADHVIFAWGAARHRGRRPPSFAIALPPGGEPAGGRRAARLARRRRARRCSSCCARAPRCRCSSTSG